MRLIGGRPPNRSSSSFYGWIDPPVPRSTRRQGSSILHNNRDNFTEFGTNTAARHARRRDQSVRRTCTRTAGAPIRRRRRPPAPASACSARGAPSPRDVDLAPLRRAGDRQQLRAAVPSAAALGLPAQLPLLRVLVARSVFARPARGAKASSGRSARRSPRRAACRAAVFFQRLLGLVRENDRRQPGEPAGDRHRFGGRRRMQRAHAPPGRRHR